ncbi:MAG: CBS domain-containing protein [Deltaproteobacteria bacterium]|nr:CBS domain-containing protein [Deltaproteobacteria bacterium]
MKSVTEKITARDIMTAEIQAVAPNLSAQEASEIMLKHNIGALVIVSPINDLLGIFTERDMVHKVVAKKKDPTKTKLEEVMTHKVMVAQATDTAWDLIQVMHREKFRHLPVVDGRKLVGIVSMKDFYESLLQNS